MLPKARNGSQILTRELDGEFIVYDKRRHRAHCLNPTVAALWQLCDGQTSISDLTAAQSRSFGLAEEERVTHLGLRQLARARLLEEHRMYLEISNGLTRRAIGRHLSLAGATAALLPLVTTIIAPTSAMAQSCLANGIPCATSAQCCSGCCNSGSGKCVGMGNCLP